jgi:flavin reductase (DIM6/NTAB) family NADH-FMN oxidoreductase RutF
MSQGLKPDIDLREVPAQVSTIDQGVSETEKRRYRNMLGQFATGVAVITTATADGRQLGVTINSFSSVSLDPPLILWNIANAANSAAVFAEGHPFAVNVLASNQEAVARQFARNQTDRFAQVPIMLGRANVPLIQGCVAHMECVVCSRYPGGDHIIILGTVGRYANAGLAPLLFHSGQYRQLPD